MKRLIYATNNLYCIEGQKNMVEVFISNEIPDVNLCTSAYSFVFKDDMFLQTELKEGERPQRRLDIPGGHIDKGETPEDAVIRETYEETGVIVSNPKLVAYVKITDHMPKKNDSKYPHPISYMLYYLCDFLREDIFNGNEDAHGRVWLSHNNLESSIWCLENKALFEEVIKRYI